MRHLVSGSLELQSWGLNALQCANHKDHMCNFGKLGTKHQNFGKPQGPSVYFTLFVFINLKKHVIIHVLQL
ncbi:hypothetical protein HanRHA438_Chr03g0100331 [Helianthus annuus]|uniref:Uncharacterized protein n=1 Tax=Helianthus annuus TaxID=4232 RepID=A0A9K3JBT9_HELAN|nr:hypothetical protein HanXRQr2_Chr03g0089121 [Helianthus annuus]KAJ0606486.1 hypothetical protein HanHA89_Chr03g0085691 [Helianthus annuus]KAJ0933806.1 hypothetical protein HanRHA438_Chr03g0100331 [Helianthus annuus]